MKRNLIFIFIVATVLILLVITCTEKTVTSAINYQYLSENKNWIISRKDSTAHSGHITLKNKVWLMHFIHWWPLTEKSPELSVEYASVLLKSLWGMPFTLTGEEGATIINGHNAYFVDGLYRNMVKTRFIVWDCPASGRRFLSDCNINIGLNTPNKLFELQVEDVTNSIRCHNRGKEIFNPKIPNHIIYADENLEFSIPSNWRSDFYIVNSKSNKNIPGHYKKGLTEKRGVVWNLMTDSEKQIDLIWENCNSKLSANCFYKSLFNFFNDTIISLKDSLKYRSVYSNVDFQHFKEKKGYFESSGNFDVVTDIVGYVPIDTSNYRFKAFSWKTKEIDYLLVASMVSHNNIWGIPFDLAPTETQFEGFINDIVLKNINNHPILLD